MVTRLWISSVFNEAAQAMDVQPNVDVGLKNPICSFINIDLVTVAPNIVFDGYPTIMRSQL